MSSADSGSGGSRNAAHDAATGRSAGTSRQRHDPGGGSSIRGGGGGSFDTAHQSLKRIEELQHSTSVLMDEISSITHGTSGLGSEIADDHSSGDLSRYLSPIKAATGQSPGPESDTHRSAALDVSTVEQRISQLSVLDTSAASTAASDTRSRVGARGGDADGSSVFFEHIPPSADAGTLREVISQLRSALLKSKAEEKRYKAKATALELQCTSLSKSLVDTQNTAMDLEDALQLRMPEMPVSGIFDEGLQKSLASARGEQLSKSRDEIKRLRLLLLQTRFAAVVLEHRDDAKADRGHDTEHRGNVSVGDSSRSGVDTSTPDSHAGVDGTLQQELARVRGELHQTTVVLNGTRREVDELKSALSKAGHELQQRKTAAASAETLLKTERAELVHYKTRTDTAESSLAQVCAQLRISSAPTPSCHHVQLIVLFVVNVP